MEVAKALGGSFKLVTLAQKIDLAEVKNYITPAHGTSTDFRLPLQESVQSGLAEPRYTAWNDQRTPFPAHRYADIRDVTQFGVGLQFESDRFWSVS